MSSDVHCWRDYHLAAPSLLRAQQQLESATSASVAARAFEELLRGKNVDAIGIALDHHHHHDAMMRHGFDNPFSVFDDLVAARARKLSSVPCAQHGLINAQDCATLQLSALSAMGSLVDDRDAALLAVLLRTSWDGDVRLLAATFAAQALGDARNEDLETLLAEISLDEERSSGERQSAVRSLAKVQRPEVADVLVRATKAAELPVQVWAAVSLADIDLDGHRQLLEQLVAQWPDDAPYPASDVLELLARGPAGR